MHPDATASDVAPLAQALRAKGAQVSIRDQGGSSSTSTRRLGLPRSKVPRRSSLAGFSSLMSELRAIVSALTTR